MRTMIVGRNTESQFFQLVAALSLAGYIIREPIQNEDNYRNDDVLQDFWSTYDPYQSGGGGVMGPVTTPILPDGQNILNHQKGYAPGNGHEALEELRSLVSWQDAHRRGDMTLPENQHVLPATGYIVHNALPNNGGSFSEDAGYASGGSIPSPGSADGSLSSVFAGSPIPDVLRELDQIYFDENSNEAESNVPKEKGIDLDEILGFDDATSNDDSENYAGFYPYQHENPLKSILSTLQSLPDDLEQIHSPFKDPSFDDFLPTRQDAAESGTHVSPTDDPFQMNYDDTSLLLNKHLPDDFLQAIETGSETPSLSTDGIDTNDFDYDFDPNELERIIFDRVINSPLKRISPDDGE